MGRVVKEPQDLLQRRSQMGTAWESFVSGLSVGKEVRRDIAASWKRSANHVQVGKDSVPISENDITKRWYNSPLSQAAGKDQDKMMQLAKEGSLVAAISDTCGNLLWTCASKHMESRADAVNFRAGGCWSEQEAGTNAVGLALKLKQAVTVFSFEHFQPFVHDWVCYASPIIHPKSGRCVGVLDLSTTWKKHTPLGQAAVNDMARSIASSLADEPIKADLEIHALGQPYILLYGEKVQLTLRQIEILSILALHPQGLHLDAFHAALYGDLPVSVATLKSEISHLRRLLDGHIDSRPYKLTLSVWADFIDIWDILRSEQIHDAVSLYRAPLLLQSQAPIIEEWRRCLDVVMQRILTDCNDPLLLMAYLHDSKENEVVRERLSELAEKGLTFL
jgi:hypothetical protein